MRQYIDLIENSLGEPKLKRHVITTAEAKIIRDAARKVSRSRVTKLEVGIKSKGDAESMNLLVLCPDADFSGVETTDIQPWAVLRKGFPLVDGDAVLDIFIQGDGELEGNVYPVWQDGELIAILADGQKLIWQKAGLAEHVCMTPGADFQIHFTDHSVGVNVELPPEVEVPDMSDDLAQKYEDEMHDAMEEIVADLIDELDPQAEEHWEQARENDPMEGVMRGLIRLVENTGRGQYRYVCNCTDSSLHGRYGDAIHDMTDQAEIIDFDDLVEAVGWEGLEDVFGHEARDLENDFAVSYFRSKWRGIPCVYVQHSRIEYIFTLNGQRPGPWVGDDEEEENEDLLEGDVEDFGSARKSLRPKDAVYDHSSLDAQDTELFRAFADLFNAIGQRAYRHQRQDQPTMDGKFRRGYGARVRYRETELLDHRPDDRQNIVTRTAPSNPYYYHRFDVMYDEGASYPGYVPASDGWKPTLNDVQRWRREKVRMDSLVAKIIQKVGKAEPKPAEPKPEPKPVDNSDWDMLFRDDD